MDCKICLQKYHLLDQRKHPRVLIQCGHTFCDSCIKQNMNLQNQIQCKQCGKVSSSQSESQFPLNQTLLTILKNNQQSVQQFIKKQQQCTIHSEKMQAYCQTDQQLVCLNCILTQHKTHKVLPIVEKVAKDKDVLKGCQQKMTKSKQLISSKLQQSKSLIDKLNLDLNDYVFDINLLYKNIVNHLKQSEQSNILQTKKTIEKSIRQILTIQQVIRERKQFYQQLVQIHGQVKSKNGIEFLKQANKIAFIKENCLLKDKYTFSYKKLEINKQKILSQTIRSLQQFLLFQKKKIGNNLDKNSAESKYQTKNTDKKLKSNMKEDSFVKDRNASPPKFQKKNIQGMKKLGKQPQVLQVNLLQKYQRYEQSKNLKKRKSDVVVPNINKSPKIEYEVKRGIKIEDVKMKKNSYNQIARVNEAKQESTNKKKSKPLIYSQQKSQRSLSNSLIDEIEKQGPKLTYIKEDLGIGMSVLNDTSYMIQSPIRSNSQSNMTFEAQAPVQIRSFMESSQYTLTNSSRVSIANESRFMMGNQRQQGTILKDSRMSFTILCLEEKVFHFGGLKNDSIDCQKIGQAAQNKISLTKGSSVKGLNRSKFQCVIMSNYNPRKFMILAGKDSSGQRCKSIIEFQLQTQKLQKSPFQLNQAISGFGAVLHQKKLYIFGGSSFTALKTMCSYQIVGNPKDLQMKRLSPMNNSRDELGFCLGFDGYIYACGGINSSNVILNSCQKYCIKTNKWFSIPAMRTPRRSFSLISLPNGLYAIGGHDGKSFLRSVQIYDLGLQKWVQVASMNQGRFTHSAIPTNDYQNIIVFGGFQNYPLKSVQIYNIIDNKWINLQDMESQRYLHCSILLRE